MRHLRRVVRRSDLINALSDVHYDETMRESAKMRVVREVEGLLTILDDRELAVRKGAPVN